MTEQQNTNLPATAPQPRRADIIVQSEEAIFDTGNFEHMMRIAKVLAKSPLVPKHLKVQPSNNTPEAIKEAEEASVANCFLVVNQARKWRADPFSVAQHTFAVSGKLGYEGKLISAMIATHPAMDGPLDFHYDGTGQNRRIIVTGRRRGETQDRRVSGTVADWRTQNEAWVRNTDQMLSYRGAREWCRRWAPQIILGIYSEDEIEEMGRQRDQQRTPARNAPAALDAFAGGQPAADAAQAPAHQDRMVDTEVEEIDKDTGEVTTKPDAGKAETEAKAEPEEGKKPDPAKPAKTAKPAVPADAIEAWKANQNWMPFYKWFAMNVPSMEPSYAQEIVNAYPDTLRAAMAKSTSYAKTVGEMLASNNLSMPANG